MVLPRHLRCPWRWARFASMHVVFQTLSVPIASHSSLPRGSYLAQWGCVPSLHQPSGLACVADFLPLPLVPHPHSPSFIACMQADRRPFNRGALLNAGFILAEAAGVDVFALQDVDFVPLPASSDLYLSPLLDEPRHLVGRVDSAGTTKRGVPEWKAVEGRGGERRGMRRAWECEVY